MSHRASWAILGVIITGVAAACSSSSSSPSTGDAGSAADASVGDAATAPDGKVAQGDSGPAGDAASGGDAGCGLDFYPSDYAPACPLLLDKYCCDAERACSGDATCMAFIACANACPVPRQDACLNACGATGSKLDAINACTKAPPYTAPPGIDCAWPR